MKNSTGKYIAIIFGTVVSIVLLVFSGVTTVRFMQNLLPAYGIGLAICLLFAVDLATLCYAIAFVYDADSFLRQAICVIMVLGNFTANVVVMVSNFILFGGQQLAYPAWLPWLVTIGVGGWIMINIGAGLGYWMASPAVRQRITATSAESKLAEKRHALSMKQIEAQIESVAKAQAGTFAQGFVNDHMAAHGGGWDIEQAAKPERPADVQSWQSQTQALQKLVDLQREQIISLQNQNQPQRSPNGTTATVKN